MFTVQYRQISIVMTTPCHLWHVCRTINPSLTQQSCAGPQPIVAKMQKIRKYLARSADIAFGTTQTHNWVVHHVCILGGCMYLCGFYSYCIFRQSNHICVLSDYLFKKEQIGQKTDCSTTDSNGTSIISGFDHSW